jgi:hypothetical protein
VYIPEATSSPAEYAEEDYNNYTEAPEVIAGSEEQQQLTPTDTYYPEYPQSNSQVDPRFR